MIARTTPGTHNPRISAQTVIHRLREIGKRPPYTMYVLYAAFLFWPSICKDFFIPNVHSFFVCFVYIYGTQEYDRLTIEMYFYFLKMYLKSFMFRVC